MIQFDICVDQDKRRRVSLNFFSSRQLFVYCNNASFLTRMKNQNIRTLINRKTPNHVEFINTRVTDILSPNANVMDKSVVAARRVEIL